MEQIRWAHCDVYPCVLCSCRMASTSTGWLVVLQPNSSSLGRTIPNIDASWQSGALCSMQLCSSSNSVTSCLFHLRAWTGSCLKCSQCGCCVVICHLVVCCWVPGIYKCVMCSIPPSVVFMVDFESRCRRIVSQYFGDFFGVGFVDWVTCWLHKEAVGKLLGVIQGNHTVSFWPHVTTTACHYGNKMSQ